MKKIILIIFGILSLVLFSCKQDGVRYKEGIKYNDVILHFNNTFGNTPIVLGKTIDTSDKGQSYIFSELKYIVSNVRLVNDKGEKFAYNVGSLDKGAALINQENPKSCNFKLSQIPQGSYRQIKFGLGVKTKLNELDQEKNPVFYEKTGGKAGNKEIAMHWYWAKGYRFLKVEGVYGTENKRLSIHVGSTRVDGGKEDAEAYVQGVDAYREIVLDLNNFIIGEEKNVLDIKADFHKLISGGAHKLTLISGEGAEANATPNAHTSEKIEEYLDNLGYENEGVFSTKYQVEKPTPSTPDIPSKEIKPMITKWRAVSSRGKTYIALNTRGGGKYKIKKEGIDVVLTKGELEDDKKVVIDLTEFGAGEYVVELSPLSDTAPMVLNMGQVKLAEVEALLEISQWGDFERGESTYGMLANCKNVVITATDIPDFSNVLEVDNMFYGCSSITQIPNIDKWNVSKVIKMSNMFNGACQFNSYIGSWNTSNVIDMTRMFAQKSTIKGKFNQDISKWDVSNVIKMESMFRSCVDFNQNISEWNVSAVRKMQAMFKDAIAFNQSIGDWKITNTYDMSEMFNGAIKFNKPLNWDTTNVRSFKNMFKGATAFNQSLSGFTIKNTNTIGMQGMLDNSGLSCTNYDATLKAWAENEKTKTRRKFSAVGLIYTDKISHDILTASTDKKGKGWTILGDTYDVNCSN